MDTLPGDAGAPDLHDCEQDAEQSLILARRAVKGELERS
jgi:hypothetical protein